MTVLKSGVGEFHADGADKQEIVLKGSATGRATIVCFGNFGGAQLEIQGKIVLVEAGVESAITTFVDDAVYTEAFQKQITIGKQCEVYLNVTGATGATDIKVKVSEVY